MEVQISQIKVGDRVRKDMGDIAALASDIDDTGQLQAIGIDSNYKLLFGERRLRAIESLGRDTIKAEIHSNLNTAILALKAERSENNYKPWTPSEAVEIARRLEAVERAEAKERQSHGETAPGKNASGKLPEASKGDTRDKVGQAVGMSGKTYEKAKAVVEAAEENPEEYGELINEMDGKSVDSAYKQLQRNKKEEMRQKSRDLNKEKIQNTKSIDELKGLFSTIVIDPPWDWGDEGDNDQLGRAKPDYHTMSIDELMAMDVGSKASKDAHIYLWITNRSLPKGFGLLESWGFRYITMITWVKPSFGMGNYFRGQTEQILFGVKGSLPLLRKNQGTVFNAPRGGGGHSSKPSEAYELIESCSPGPYLEIFSRSSRKDWTHWGEND